MSVPVLICDDSNMARKQMARTLPKGWDVEITFAANGAEGIEAIKAGKGNIVFLDLNMPVMDGYQALEIIQQQSLNALVIVVSGDIQPDAHKRVIALGALAFIKKPITGNEIERILIDYGIVDRSELVPTIAEAKKDKTKKVETKTAEARITEIKTASAIATRAPKAEVKAAKVKSSVTKTDMFITPDLSEIPFSEPHSEPALSPLLRDALQEVTNVAMGQAADLLAKLLDVFVLLPVPNVNVFESSELTMTLASAAEHDTISTVCQGFICSGMSGEALLLFHDSSFADMAKLMKIDEETEFQEKEILMDTANILIGAFLRGISQQLNVSFSQGHPSVLSQHRTFDEIINSNVLRKQRTLAVEINYSIEHHNIQCDLLLLFTENSIPAMANSLSYLID